MMLSSSSFAATDNLRDPIATQVLDLRFFRQITDRFEGIAEAHQQTFEWIYRNPISSHKPWDNFNQWLRSGTGCYWISGKAGSGKSTLSSTCENNFGRR
jgi:hypothetical protein